MIDKYHNRKIQTIVKIALYAAIVATVTMFTSVQYTQGGYFNLGDVVIMLLAVTVPFRHAIFAVSIGSMLADLLVGALHYTIFTGVIKSLMVFLIFVLRKQVKGKFFFIPFLLSSIMMVLLYGVVDAVLLGGYTFFASMLTNSVQGVLGFVITSIAYPFSIKLRDYLED